MAGFSALMVRDRPLIISISGLFAALLPPLISHKIPERDAVIFLMTLSLLAVMFFKNEASISGRKIHIFLSRFADSRSSTLITSTPRQVLPLPFTEASILFATSF